MRAEASLLRFRKSLIAAVFGLYCEFMTFAPQPPIGQLESILNFQCKFLPRQLLTVIHSRLLKPIPMTEKQESGKRSRSVFPARPILASPLVPVWRNHEITKHE